MTGRPAGPGTREKILVAAATMLGENPTARLSVRAVAARAGVSTGSLRHFFPTQRELLETVVAAIYDVEIPDDPIHDTARPPADRLLDCLRQMLAQVGTGERAREFWRTTVRSYVATAPTDDEAAAYLALERWGLHLVERWLTVLVDEGAIPPGDVPRQARFLSTVLNGVVVERALPGAAQRLEHETGTLRLAVEAVVPPADAQRPGA
ncbi:TetR/AcrR family transcriptional regulator [Cellulomonas sp. SLBN-39]|uniref:TetR/AcrR family transcriptional regulator n=1 Tax=Cellulomonas sp. SLBN-39 TaxID=2768446 RepID=UPI001150F117|nr:TetR/AcrR family transcriptional regulator [Cellulomonas sp. SLBN-39]TQL03974.1 TetR family transcriptional regulator [Cellulomonas sp. SLBN-39]